jgi:hypothetical protein
MDDDAKYLDEFVFIPDEEFEHKKKWVDDNVKSMGWRDGFIHQKIYNELAYKLGILDKIEQTRQRISIDSAQELIKLLHIIGYGGKRIAYWLWKWGYKGISYKAISAHIRINRKNWNKERERFMAELIAARDSIFQTLKKEVMDAEKRTLTILLGNIDKLQDRLETLDPVENKAEYNTTLNQIVKLEERCKSYHGLNELRASWIKGTAEVAIHKGKLEADREPPKALDVGGQTAELME